MIDGKIVEGKTRKLWLTVLSLFLALGIGGLLMPLLPAVDLSRLSSAAFLVLSISFVVVLISSIIAFLVLKSEPNKTNRPRITAFPHLDRKGPVDLTDPMVAVFYQRHR